MATAAALDDEEYAHLDGEDEFGEAYRTDEIPSEMWEILDENGEYEVPSFIDRTIRRDEQECWVISHTPTAGTIRTCPQTFEVQLRYTCDGIDEYMARLPITLIDIHPPTVTVQISGDQDVKHTYCGLPYFVSPVTVTAIVDVTDACDPDPVFEELLLNGEAYVPGSPITTIGLHTLMIVVRDGSENATVRSRVFEIRDRPNYPAAAVVEAAECISNGNGEVETFNATVLISAATFEPAQMSSVRMILYDSDGQWLHNALVRAQQAELTDCYFRLEFSVDLSGEPLAECPAILDLIGVGYDGADVLFSWGARTPNQVLPDAVDALLSMVGREEPCGGAVQMLVPEPPDCKFEQRMILHPDKICEVAMPPISTSTCNAKAQAKVTAMSTTVFGGGQAEALHTAPPDSCAAEAECGTGWNTGTFIARFVGDCCNCTVTVNSHVSVRALASAEGTNLFTVDAKAVGEVHLLGSCGDQAFVRAEAHKTYPPTTGVLTSNQSGGTSCTGALGDESACEGWVRVETMGYIRANCTATATQNIFGHPTLSTCKARARVMCDGVETQVSASAVPCAGGDPIIITPGG